MRLLTIYRYLTVGGVESVLRARLEGLPDHGLDAQAWFLADAGGRRHFGPLENRIRVGDLPALRHELMANPPDVVTSMDTPEALSLAAETVPEVPRILEVHTPYKENLEYLRGLSSSSAKAVFVPSEHQKKVVEARLRHRWPIRVIPNALSNLFASPRQSQATRPQRPIVAWIGRLDFLKQWALALHIFAGLRDGATIPELWVVGSAPLRRTTRELYSLARRLGVLRDLRWFKGVRYDAIPSFLAAVRTSGGVVLSTSRGESFGMVVAEAMASGCLAVAPRLGPFHELLTHGVTGLLYRPGSVKDGARSVSWAIDNPGESRTMAVQARSDALARFRPEIALAQLASALHDLAPGSAHDGAIEWKASRQDTTAWMRSGVVDGPGS